MDILIVLWGTISFVQTLDGISDDCFGVHCKNNGILEQTDGQCLCVCANGYSGIYCEYRLETSEWPPGPYALPRSKDGCPESASHGWSRGYAKFTTTIPLTLVSTKSSMNIIYNGTANTVLEYQEMHNIKRPDDFFANYLLGPFGEFSFQINFCFKQMDHPLNAHTDIWPTGDYSIYGMAMQCPQGFDMYNITLRLPPLDHWLSDGYLPFMNVTNSHNHDTITFSMCRRQPDTTQVLATFTMPFVIIKGGAMNCEPFDSFEMAEESIWIHDISGSPEIDGISFCNYWPSALYDELYFFRYKDNLENLIWPLFVTRGGLLTVYQESTPYWFYIDMPTAMIITHLRLFLYEQFFRTYYQYHGKLLKSDWINIYISNNKWDFLNDGAEFANRYTVMSTSQGDLTFFTFVKPIQGRYLSVVEKQQFIRASPRIDINAWQVEMFIATDVFKKHGDYEQVCNQELGVRHSIIGDFQMTASSWLPDYPPYHGRLFHNGWCAESTDTSAFLQIDLLITLLVEGITIRNNYRIVERGHQYPYEKDVEPVGSKSFQIIYGTDDSSLKHYNSQDYVFKIDLSKGFTDEQAFSFYKPFLARFVRVYVKEALLENEACLRIELIGCNKHESHTPVHQNTSKCYMKTSDTLYLPLTSVYKTSTSPDRVTCEKQCLDEKDICGATVFIQYINSTCTFLRHSDDALYPPIQLNDTVYVDEHSAKVSILVCQKDGHKEISNAFHYGENKYVSYISESDYTLVTAPGVITNIGYPFQYMSEHAHVWHIKFRQREFIKLMFSDISLLVTENSKYQLLNNRCTNNITIAMKPLTSIEINNHMFYKMDYSGYPIKIDYTYNGQTPIYDLEKTEVYIIFSTCFRNVNSIKQIGHGFRVVVGKQDIPACYQTLSLDDADRLDVNVFCSLPVMRLTSSYFLGLKQDAVQSWTIQTYIGKVIELEIIDFYVKCTQTNTVFTIKEVINDVEVPYSYCNMDQPSRFIYSTFNELIVEFYAQQAQPPSQLLPEGFNAIYRSLDKYEKLAGLITYDTLEHTTVRIDTGLGSSLIDPQTQLANTNAIQEREVKKSDTDVVKNSMDSQTIENNTIPEFNYVYKGSGCSELLQKCYTMFIGSDISWRDGRYICNTRGLKMAVIHLALEMQIIRALLFKNYDFQISISKTLHTYIGLVRYIDYNGEFIEVWIDGKALMYNAWDVLDQRDAYRKQCTRMAFNLANKNNTWESIDCDEPNSADLLVCENDTSSSRTTEGTLLTDKSIASQVSGDKFSLSSLLYQCPDREWISFVAVCNGYPDCLDGADEINCTDKSLSDDGSGCSSDFFRCNGGRCIDLSKVCNFIIDCEFGDDEFCDEGKECDENSFRCDDGRCIFQVLRCDGQADCYDKSDEIFCATCSSNAFQCDDLSCIRDILVCDGYPDCSGRKDETNCGLSSCLQLWEKGFKQTGDYVIGGYDVVCDFDNVPVDQRIRTVIKDIDIERESIHPYDEALYYIGSIGIHQSIYAKFLYKDELIIERLIEDEKLDCSLQILRTCAPWVLQLANVDDVHRNLSYALCETQTHVGPLKNPYPLVNTNQFNVRYKNHRYTHMYGLINPLLRYSVTIECLSEPLTETFTPVIPCGVDQVSIPIASRCLYQVYNGITNGCRTNMHLQQCQDFQCPSRYVKCPSSYCIQPQLVCDGIKHCPRGEDERNCWCVASKSSITLVYYGHADDMNRRYIFDLGRQLVSVNGEVRLIQVVKSMDDLLNDLRTTASNINFQNIRFEILSMLDSIGVDRFGQLLNIKDQPIPVATFTEVLTDILALFKQVKGNTEDYRYGQIKDLLFNLKLKQRNIINSFIEEEVILDKITVSEQYIFEDDNLINNNIKHVYDSTVQNLVSNLLSYSRVQYTNKSLEGGLLILNDNDEPSSQANFIELLKKEILSALSRKKVPTLPTDCHIYHVRKNKTMNEDAKRSVAHDVIDINIQDWNWIGSLGSRMFTELCQDAHQMECTDGYMCMSSRVCIYIDQLCDNVTDCPYRDDEIHCEFFCPPKCHCTGYVANCSNRDFDLRSFDDVSPVTRGLDLSYNTVLSLSDITLTVELAFLIKMNLSHCQLSSIAQTLLRMTKNLHILDISYNRFTIIRQNTFNNLKYLTTLILKGNFDLQVIEPGAFYGLNSLIDLSVTHASLKVISSNSFLGLNITTLDLSYNRIKEIENFAFNYMDVKEINIEGNDIQVFKTDIFTGVTSLNSLRTPSFKFCCIRPTYLLQSKCLPEADEFSSCDDLMRNSALQTILWLIGLASLLGNVLSVIYRLVFDRKRLKLGYGIFVTNLAVADFLMGVYLIMIASADIAFRKRYILVEFYWRNSVWCNMAGVLSTISSEASVFFLLLITLDRILVIKYPFGQFRFTPTTAMICSVISWIASVIIAFVPILNESYFQNLFYTRTGVCLALPLTRDRPPGWMYSIMVFIVFNFVTFVLVACGQLMIFMEVQKQSSRMKRITTRTNDLRIARNLLLVVTTDFLCWFPIGCMGIMAIQGHVISGDVYAWTAVLILPINSALNPFLYTLSAMLGDKKFAPRVTEQNTYVTKEVEEKQLQCAKRCLDLLELIFPRDAGNTHDDLMVLTVSELRTSQHRLSVLDIAALSRQLSAIVYACHRCDVSHGYILDSTVQIGLTKNYEIGSGIIIRLRPRLCTGRTDKEQDIYNMGCVVRKLMQLAG